MRYLLIVFLAFVSSAQAQILESYDGGSQWRRYEGMRYRENAEFRRRHMRYYRRSRMYHVRSEDNLPRGREAQVDYLGWRAPEKGNVYSGWWRPEGGWRNSDLHDGLRLCRPPMHAAGAADARLRVCQRDGHQGLARAGYK